MRFGRWKVLKIIDERDKFNQINWLCQCDCGNIRSVNGNNLRQGYTVSCGCYKQEASIYNNTKHGDSGGWRGKKPRLYCIWMNMRGRCKNTNKFDYKYYGARGIDICRDWEDYSVFREWAYKNGYKNNLTIDRVDNNKGYSPNNCRWSDRKTQSNNKSTNRNIYYNGEIKTMSEWADVIGISVQTLSNRINTYHWDIEKAISEPVRKCGNSEE